MERAPVIECEFEIEQMTGPETYIYKCKWCGQRSAPTKLPAERVHAKCNKQERPKDYKLPSLAKRGYNYAKAAAKHYASGAPDSPVQVIEQRYKICIRCPAGLNIGTEHGACALCGCYINLMTAQEGRNKLAWADSWCPWKGEDGVEGEPRPKWPAVNGSHTEGWNSNNPHYTADIDVNAVT